jgi:sulfur transfer complex TusBCD TusB component (DsrH family)
MNNKRTMKKKIGSHVYAPPQKKKESVLFIHNGIYAAMKKNEMLSFAGKWIELENIILSEVSLA